MNQVIKFTKLLFVLQKKNSVLGFLIGCIPTIITAIAIEFFIGRIIFQGTNNLVDGFKALNVLIFFLITQSISLSLTSITKYKQIIKNSYLKIDTVIFGETIIQTINFFLLLVFFSLVFKFSLSSFFLISMLMILILFYILAISNLISILAVVIDDFDRILNIAFQVSFWLSPIIFTLRDISSNLKYIIMLNPFHIFYELNYLIFYPKKFDLFIFTVSVLSNVLFIIFLIIFLKKLRNKIRLFL